MRVCLLACVCLCVVVNGIYALICTGTRVFKTPLQELTGAQEDVPEFVRIMLSYLGQDGMLLLKLIKHINHEQA